MPKQKHPSGSDCSSQSERQGTDDRRSGQPGHGHRQADAREHDQRATGQPSYSHHSSAQPPNHHSSGHRGPPRDPRPNERHSESGPRAPGHNSSHGRSSDNRDRDERHSGSGSRVPGQSSSHRRHHSDDSSGSAQSSTSNSSSIELDGPHHLTEDQARAYSGAGVDWDRGQDLRGTAGHADGDAGTPQEYYPQQDYMADWNAQGSVSTSAWQDATSAWTSTGYGQTQSSDSTSYAQAYHSTSTGYDQQPAQGWAGYDQPQSSTSAGYSQQPAQGWAGYGQPQSSTSAGYYQQPRMPAGSSVQAWDGRQQTHSLTTQHGQGYDYPMSTDDGRRFLCASTVSPQNHPWPPAGYDEREYSVTPTVDRPHGYSSMPTERGQSPSPVLSPAATDNGSNAMTDSMVVNASTSPSHLSTSPSQAMTDSAMSEVEMTLSHGRTGSNSSGAMTWEHTSQVSASSPGVVVEGYNNDATYGNYHPATGFLEAAPRGSVVIDPSRYPEDLAVGDVNECLRPSDRNTGGVHGGQGGSGRARDGRQKGSKSSRR